jgi:DNA-directed RNA polymerase specialized sigma24 family protein
LRERAAAAVAPAALEAGGEAAFCAFYRSSRDPVARALAVTLGDPDLAAEAVDEAMARAYQRWAHVEVLGNPAGWVYRVAFNWAASGLRRRRRLPRFLARPEVTGIGAVGEPAVAEALAELEVRQRAVVVCRYLLGWSVAETAAALNTPEGTVKSRLHRASRLLAARLSHLRSEEGQ